MILESKIGETSLELVKALTYKEDAIKAAKEELKNVFEDRNINYKSYKDNLYVNRVLLGKNKREFLCLVLNDKVSIYIDKDIDAICGDIITGEWLDLDLEECEEYLKDMLKVIGKDLI